jgi:hypothetical protein
MQSKIFLLVSGGRLEGSKGNLNFQGGTGHYFLNGYVD